MTRSKLTPARKINLTGTPQEIARQLSHLSGLAFFDTVGNLPAHHHPPLSIIGANPISVETSKIQNPSRHLQQLIQQKAPSQGNTPQLPNGAACGWVDYNGDYTFGDYPNLLIYHHQTSQWWETGPNSRSLSNQLKNNPPEHPANITLGTWQDSLPRADFISAVHTIKDYIAAGDIYQVNLSRRLRTTCHAPDGLLSLYEKLRTTSPAPTASYLHLNDREILSSSPETFLHISGDQIETRPIKGTRPRYPDPTRDAQSAYDLQHSEKERAELIMITDLLRNDLGQVCQYGTVKVTDILQLEKLQHVHHLVSTIRGTLTPEHTALTALAACFPGGSITGAPKKRATEIITELEPVPRGLYTGAIGYLGYNGESQFNIAIRTLIHEHGHLDYHIGAGIVADSDPAAEFDETDHKAQGMRLALSGQK